MKKWLVLMGISLFLLTGCVQNSARDPVTHYLELYRNHSDEVTSSLQTLIRDENLFQEQQDLYELIMKRQYVDLEYKVVNETYNGNQAVITVLITVYDYQHSKDEARKELEANLSEYTLLDGSINQTKYKDLQLEKMKEEKNRVKYTIDFDVNLHDEEWELVSPDYTVLLKIHGIYDYNED